MPGPRRTARESAPSRGPLALGLIGRPVSHSASPAIHGAAFEAWGLEASYRAIDVAPLELETWVARLAASGGGNVTLPYKERVATLLDAPGDEVRATGACNCFWRAGDGALRGENTDVGGFVAACRDLAVELEGARVLLLGAGGAARAVAHALALGGVARLDVWNRTRARAESLAGSFRGEARVLDERPRGAAFELVVNATRLGLRDDEPLPLDLSNVEAEAALDLVYGAGGTPWVRHAAALGVRAADGLGMLVHQAALSLRCWFPDRTPPLAAMRRAARAALGAGP